MLFPPRVLVSAELRWMLLRAFGPVDAPPPALVRGGVATDLAGRFLLQDRIGARIGSRRLVDELGARNAEAFALAARASSIDGLRLTALARLVAEAAADLRIPLIFVKFLALHAQGRLLSGSRGAMDVDVLVPTACVGELQAALVGRGLVAGDCPASEQHVPPLRSPRGGAVELHTLLLGVRFPRRDGSPRRRGPGSSATAEDFLAAGCLDPLDGWPGECRVPKAAPHLAYLLAHGLAQHGPFADSYPLFRVLADVEALGGGDGALTSSVAPLVRSALRAAEVSATFGLTRRLMAGDDCLYRELELEGRRTSPEAELLRHILARTLSEGYRGRLALRSLLLLSDHAAVPLAARRLRSRVLLSRQGVDDRYGPQRGPAGYLGRRLFRPLDLLARGLRYSGLLGRPEALDLRGETLARPSPVR